MKEIIIKTDEISIHELWETVSNVANELDNQGNTQLANDLLFALSNIIPMPEN